MTTTLLLNQPSTADDQYALGQAHGQQDAADNLDVAVSRATALDNPAYASPWSSGYITAVYTASLRRTYPNPE
jgi:hypothetical protein